MVLLVDHKSQSSSWLWKKLGYLQRPYDLAAINFGSPQLIYIHPVIPLLWKSHGVLALQALREFMLKLVSQVMEAIILKKERENDSLMQKGIRREMEGE